MFPITAPKATLLIVCGLIAGIAPSFVALKAGEADRRSPQRFAASDGEPGLHVWFRLDRPSGSRYRRPYVAVWLEDADGFPVKTGALWLMTEQPGPRWHRDLTRWYRNDRMRKIVEKTDLIDGISGATRGPGTYEVYFDGTDNHDQRLPEGTYTLCLEAARENGTYKIIRERFQWGGDAIERTDLPGNLEITAAAMRFVPKK